MFKFILILALKDIILFMILMKNPKNFILIFIILFSYYILGII